MIMTTSARDVSTAVRETLAEIECDPAFCRLVTILEGLWIAAAMAD